MTERYDLLEDWKAIWRYADASAIFYYSEEGGAESFTSDLEAFDADVKAVSNGIGACMQASITDEGITNQHIDNLEEALAKLWNHVNMETAGEYEIETLQDYEEVSRGALAWAVSVINLTN